MKNSRRCARFRVCYLVRVVSFIIATHPLISHPEHQAVVPQINAVLGAAVAVVSLIFAVGWCLSIPLLTYSPFWESVVG